MNELLLAYIWQFQYFNKTGLFTTEGEPVTIFQTGFRNINAGPDFFNARIRVGDIEWSGSVELHIFSSGWYAHKHDLDDAYENVVLHVVWQEDRSVVRKDGTPLPTIELKGRVEENLLLNYKRLVNTPEQIPCSVAIQNVNGLTKMSMLDKALAQRLEKKALNVIEMLKRNQNDWEETCYQLLCRNFGFKVNTEPFEQLSLALPYKVLMKHGDKLHQIEALLFGQAGFLDDDVGDEYFQLLKRESEFLSKKYGLEKTRMNKSQWRFLRLRPANFPTIRIAQLANLLHMQRNIFSRVISSETYDDLLGVFTSDQSPYWKRHYQFGKTVNSEIPALGASSVDNLIINTAANIMTAYGKSYDDQLLIDTAMAILQQIPAESNYITDQWSTLNFKSRSAFDSQALIELYNHFCLRRRCLECNIGASFLRPLYA